LIHFLGKAAGGEVPDELAGVDDIGDTVLPARAGKANDRWFVVETIEKTIGREIALPLSTARGDPAYGSGGDNRI